MERRLVERIVTALQLAEKQRAEAVSKAEFEARMKQQFELNFYRSRKKKVKCIHKPTGLLQSQGPFRPLPNILLLYFKCEEGLRALLSMLESKKKIAARGKVSRSSIRKSIRIAREKMDPHYKEEEEETIIKVRIDQLCLLTGEAQLKVELVPVEPKAKPKARPPQGPVAVELQDVGGERPVKLKLRPTGSTLDSAGVGGERPVQAAESATDATEGPVKVKFHEGGMPLRLELLANPDYTDSTSQESPVDGTKTETEVKSELERPSSPSKVMSEEKSGGAHLRPEGVWIDDIEGTIGKPEVKKQRLLHSPVKVNIKENESGLVKVDVIPEQVMMADVGEAPRRVEPQATSTKQDWVAREYDYPRTKLYDKEEWVPREEDDGLSLARRDSILWFDRETESDVLRTSSTKPVWYPNDKYLEGREWTSLQTSSMKLLRRLRPTVDRPQFKVSPEVVNFRKVRLGATALQIVTLYNYQSDFSRFKISSQDGCISVVYEHGPLAAGMARRLKVYLKGSTQGQFAGKVHIETEFDIFIVPVLAEVLQV